MRRIINLLLWAALIIAVWHMAELDTWLRQTPKVSPRGMSGLTFSDAALGKQILWQWKQFQPTNLILVAQRSLHTDFVFLFCYVALIWRLNYTQMLREYRPWLNDMLRLNILLGILTGTLDVVENICLLHNLSHFEISAFCVTKYIAIAKYAVASWVILLYLFSIVSLPLLKQMTKARPVYS